MQLALQVVHLLAQVANASFATARLRKLNFSLLGMTKPDMPAALLMSTRRPSSETATCSTFAAACSTGLLTCKLVTNWLNCRLRVVRAHLLCAGSRLLAGTMQEVA